MDRFEQQQQFLDAFNTSTETLRVKGFNQFLKATEILWSRRNFQTMQFDDIKFDNLRWDRLGHLYYTVCHSCNLDDYEDETNLRYRVDSFHLIIKEDLGGYSPFRYKRYESLRYGGDGTATLLEEFIKKNMFVFDDEPKTDTMSDYETQRLLLAMSRINSE